MKLRVLGIIAFLMAALHVSAFAVDEAQEQGSEIGGMISGFLKRDKSPYTVKETLVVPEDKALVIEAGVELFFAEGTGLDVRGGSLVVMGENNNPVLFAPVKEDGYWNGISVTGIKRAEAQGFIVRNAEYGFAVESGALELRDGSIENVSHAAVYARNASVEMQWIKVLDGKNIGVWATQSALVTIDGSTLRNNKFALVTTDGSIVDVERSQLESNDVAVLDFGDNRLRQRNSLIEGNHIGFISMDLPSAEFKPTMSDNEINLSKNVEEYVGNLGDEPKNPHADGMKLIRMNTKYSQKEEWNISGGLGIEMGYHKVLMSHHHDAEPYVSGTDTVWTDDRYINYFQVPGLFTNMNVNLVMESSKGKKIEFLTDVSSDGWDHFKVHQLRAAYTDDMQKIVLGDFYANAGELYLSGINAFGGSYELSLFKNKAEEPLFVGSAFVGEVNAPKIEGRRNYDVYKDYVDDGEAEAQKMVAGGNVRWNMHRRFNGTLGFIGSKDYLEDPFLRDGNRSDVNTANPLMTSRTFYADGHWLFFPGDIKLNGQLAVGGADTANLAKIRAVNQVFADAGLDASNFGLLNKLMKNPNLVNSLSRESLETIFGENVAKTPSEMRAELKMLLEKASKVAKETKVEDARPSHGDFWGHEHLAVAGSYQWTGPRTFIEGFLRYVGSAYYSAGSPDLLQNTRMIGGNLKHKIYDFWELGFGYTMNVENAADTSDGYNIFGMAEGSQWGMFSGAESDWLKEHEQDQNRTLYIHDAYLKNSFKLNENAGLTFKYAMNYRTRSTPQRLYANYSVNSGIYNDPWFRASRGPTMKIENGSDTLLIDSVRWAQYYSLADEEYLATQFEEKLLKHTVELGLSYKLNKNLLNVGAALVVRTDLSEFKQDELISQFNFSDETFGILGYYFHGGDFIEQRYPVSLTTTLDGFRNMVSVTPRYKIYNRNEMREFEWNLMDNMTVDLSKDFLKLTLGTGLRQNFLSYEIDGEDYDEMELDLEGSTTLRVYHKPSLYTDWTVGSIFNYRPDCRSDQYKDFYVMAALNYEF